MQSGLVLEPVKLLKPPNCHPERSEGSLAIPAQDPLKIPRGACPERSRRARNDISEPFLSTLADRMHGMFYLLCGPI